MRRRGNARRIIAPLLRAFNRWQPSCRRHSGPPADGRAAGCPTRVAARAWQTAKTPSEMPFFARLAESRATRTNRSITRSMLLRAGTDGSELDRSHTTRCAAQRRCNRAGAKPTNDLIQLTHALADRFQAQPAARHQEGPHQQKSGAGNFWQIFFRQQGNDRFCLGLGQPIEYCFDPARDSFDWLPVQDVVADIGHQRGGARSAAGAQAPATARTGGCREAAGPGRCWWRRRTARAPLPPAARAAAQKRVAHGPIRCQCPW